MARDPDDVVRDHEDAADGLDTKSDPDTAGEPDTGSASDVKSDHDGPRDSETFDPTSPEARDIGREMVDGSEGLGSLVAHLYRGEVDREVNWRQRLDSTTNWAVTVIAAILAYAFANDDVAHSIVLVAMLIGVMFVLIEARRFQRYDVWRARVRSMQENLFAVALDPSEGVEQRDWRRQLSRDYRHPEMKLPFRIALAHRLRRVYLPLLFGLLLVWLFRLSGEEGSLVAAASVDSAPGWLVLAAVGVGYLTLLGIAIWPDVGESSELEDDGDRGDLDHEF